MAKGVVEDTMANLFLHVSTISDRATTLINAGQNSIKLAWLPTPPLQILHHHLLLNLWLFRKTSIIFLCTHKL